MHQIHRLLGRHLHDAFLNAAMLLGGMGPVDKPETEAGKVFAGLYALYAGLCSSSQRRWCSRPSCIACFTLSTQMPSYRQVAAA